MQECIPINGELPKSESVQPDLGLAPVLIGTIILIACKLNGSLLVSALGFLALFGIAVTNPVAGLAMSITTGAIPDHFMLGGLEFLGSLSRMFVLVSGLSFFVRGRYSAAAGDPASDFFSPMLLPALFCCWSALTAFWAEDSMASVMVLQTLAINLFLFFLILVLDGGEKDRLTRMVVFSGVILVAYCLYQGRAHASPDVIYGDRMSLDDLTNPNKLGLGIVQLLPFCLLGLQSGDKWLSRLYYIIGVVFAFVIVLKTVSRTSLVAGMTIVAISFLPRFSAFGSTRKASLKASFTILPCILLSLGGVLIAEPTILEQIVIRITFDAVLQDSGGDRFILWQTMLSKVIPYNFLTGIGIGGLNEIRALKNLGALTVNASHNMYVSLLVQVGLIGASIFLIMLLRAILLALTRYRFDVMMRPYMLCIVASCILGFGESVFTTKILWAASAFCLSGTLKMDNCNEEIRSPVR